jgi:hypothetical protein
VGFLLGAMHLLVTFDSSALQTVIAGLDAAAQGAFRTKLAGVIEKIGHEVHQALISPMMAQTGLTHGTIPAALHDMADPGGLTYQIATRGGDISLRYFGAHEENGGVVASPRGKVTFYAGAFRRSGRDPRRMSPKLNTQVYMPDGNGASIREYGKAKGRGGSWWRKFHKVKSGVYIPQELLRGVALRTFETIVAARLEPEVASVMTMIVGRR